MCEICLKFKSYWRDVFLVSLLLILNFAGVSIVDIDVLIPSQLPPVNLIKI